MNYCLGIDLGTSSVKINAINDKGEIIAENSSSYSTLRPETDHAEQEPEEWWQQTLSSLKKIKKEIEEEKKAEGVKPKITAIGVSGQMHGLVACDKLGQVLRPALIWSDNRTKEEVEHIKNLLNANELKKLANPVVTNFTLPKILWMKRKETEIWQRVDKIILPKDYIVYRLTGKFCTDYTDASGTLLFDVEKRSWLEFVLKKFKINQEVLPRLKSPGSIVGDLQNTVVQTLNIEGRSIPVITAGGDAPLTALASGVISVEEAGVSLGTAGQILLPTDKCLREKDLRLHTMSYFADFSVSWFLMGAILSAGYNYQWLVEDIFQLEGSIADFLKDQEENIADVPPGSKGLIYLPYLQGERSPINDPRAVGCFWGLTAEHKRCHLLRSILEGVAFALRWNLDIMEKLVELPKRVFLSGGGAASNTWAQVISDILQLPVLKSDQIYGPAYGAALLAGKNSKLSLAPEEIIDSNLSSYRVFKPVSARRNIYQKTFELYKDLYLDNKEKMHKLRRLQGMENCKK